MASRVLYGTGKPRIVIELLDIPPQIEQFTAVSFNQFTHPSNLEFTITGFQGELNNDFISLKLAANSGFENETWGKITGFDDSADKLTVDGWTNGYPQNGDPLTISAKIIDLPYCQQLPIWFEIDSYPEKKLYNTGKKIITHKGYYFNAVLNYENFSDFSLLKGIQNLYDNRLTNGFSLYPRNDNPQVVFNCIVNPEYPLALSQLPAHKGHKGLQIHLKGTDRLSAAAISQCRDDNFTDGYYLYFNIIGE